jgi:hypothetical protein
MRPTAATMLAALVVVQLVLSSARAQQQTDAPRAPAAAGAPVQSGNATVRRCVALR